jgi:hypothetical protein
MALELLRHGAGVGVVISPRDLSFENAVAYAEKYRDLDAHVVVDPQFHFPAFRNRNLESYPTARFRSAVTDLMKIGEAQLGALARRLQIMNAEINADAVIAPAVVYEARNQAIAELNSKLFAAAKKAGDDLGIPTYATVVIGRDAISAVKSLEEALSFATALNADGWYFAYEFDAERVPSVRDAVFNCGAAVLALACTGKPVLQAYAGPMALLSQAFGATAAAVGHSQTLWRFSAHRFRPSTAQGGGGDAPPRFFSSSLWGTLVHPDDTVRLLPTIANQVATRSPYNTGGGFPLPTWSKHEASKHFLYVVCDHVGKAGRGETARAIAASAQQRLRRGYALYERIQEAGIAIRDGANQYHLSWCEAVDELLQRKKTDYDYLEML